MTKARFLLDNFGDKATIYSYQLNSIVDISNIDIGAVTEVGDEDTTSFEFYNIVVGSEYLSNRTQIITTADVSDSLDGTYFTIDTPTDTYYLWYSTNDSTTVPTVSGAIGIKVNINTNDSATIIATKTKLSLYTISDFSVVDGFTSDEPINNVQNSFRNSYAKSVNNTNIEIVGEFDKFRPISCLAIGRHKLPINTRYRLRLYNDATGEDRYLKYDTGFLLVETDLTNLAEEFDPDVTLVTWLPDIIDSIIYFKLNFYIENETLYYTNTNASIPATNSSFIDTNDANTNAAEDISLAEYFEFGRLFIGKYTEVLYNLSYGHKLTWEENTKQYRPGSGTLRSDNRDPFRKIEFNLSTIPEVDRPELQQGFRTVGLRRDFFLSLFPTDDSLDKQEDYSGIVKLTKVPIFTEFANNYYTSKYIIEEV